ncbi:MAG TPA: bifunctional UDP-sugar hydrolase/5'-nucleotidase [Bacteroidota bacterium]|nr:bifunctional UDP-sugar hydrolase/5'-nucleotidase [Bacteroidota bacterium]
MNRFTTRIRLAIAAFGLFSIGSMLAGEPGRITILHTNDIHASFTPHEAFWIKSSPKPLIGGMTELSWAVDSLRKVKPGVLLIDAGDMMTGNPITEYTYRGAYGGALFEMMNRIGYNLWCPGNHDFDISQDNLRLLTRIANFPTVSANLVRESGGAPVNNKPYTILESNGVKVGVIGLTTTVLNQLIVPANFKGLKVLSTTETAQKYIDELRSKVDVVAAVTHQGVEEDSSLAANVHGLDVIIGGHSHTRLKHPLRVNHVLIVQTGSNLENLGVLDLTVENGRITKYDGNLLPLWYTSERPATDLSRFVDSIKTAIDSDYSETLLTVKTDLKNTVTESALGNFITDAQRTASGADIAFMNTHGIRKNVAAGSFTKKDLFEVLPFRNVLVTFPVTGAQVRRIVQNYLDEHPAIQTSGIRCTYKRGADGKAEIVSLLIDGTAVSDQKVYKAAANDYLVSEAKRYLGIEVTNQKYTSFTLFKVVEKKMREDKLIPSAVENRISEVK